MSKHSPNRNWAEPSRFALLLAVMVFIPFWNVLLGFDTFVARDFGLFSLPVASFHKECFWKGQWPLWNPYDCCGLPFLAQFNTLALYPLSLIYLLLPLTWSLPAFCLFHVFLGGMGMYFLARRWTSSEAGAALAGVAFAFNGLSLNFLMWPSHIATFSWIPWVLLLTESGWRKGGTNMVIAALAAGMQILGGGPETVAFTWLILLVLAVAECARNPGAFSTTARRFVTMGVLALCLAAAQLLPTIDFALHSHRDLHYGHTGEWSMPLTGGANLLVPMFHTISMGTMSAQPGQYWTSSYYAGVGMVFLTGIAFWRGWRSLRVWLPAAFLAASLVLALGYDGYVFRWVQEVIPILGVFQFPVKFVILTLTVTPLLAAAGMAQYEKRAIGGWREWRPEMVWGGVMLALFAVILWAARQWPVEGSSWTATAVNGLWRVLFLLLTIASLLLFALRPAWRGWSIVPLLAVAWLDVLTHQPWQNPTVDPSVFRPGLAAMNARFNVMPDIAESRVMISSLSARELYYHPAVNPKSNFLEDRIVFLGDCNLLDDVPKVDGFFSLNLHESDDVLRLLDSRTGRKLDSIQNLLSVSQTIAPGHIFDWAPRTNYIPIVSVGQAPIFTDAAGALDAIDKDRVDFRSAVCLPTEARETVRAVREPRARILAKKFTANEESIDVDTPAPTTVVLSQSYYHNWEASLDGNRVPLWRANHAFQAVETPAGRHHIVLVYRDKAFRWGGAVSIGSLLACGMGWLKMSRKHPKPAALPETAAPASR